MSQYNGWKSPLSVERVNHYSIRTSFCCCSSSFWHSTSCAFWRNAPSIFILTLGFIRLRLVPLIMRGYQAIISQTKPVTMSYAQPLIMRECQTIISQMNPAAIFYLNYTHNVRVQIVYTTDETYGNVLFWTILIPIPVLLYQIWFQSRWTIWENWSSMHNVPSRILNHKYVRNAYRHIGRFKQLCFQYFFRTFSK